MPFAGHRLRRVRMNVPSRDFGGAIADKVHVARGFVRTQSRAGTVDQEGEPRVALAVGPLASALRGFSRHVSFPDDMSRSDSGGPTEWVGPPPLFAPSEASHAIPQARSDSTQ